MTKKMSKTAPKSNDVAALGAPRLNKKHDPTTRSASVAQLTDIAAHEPSIIADAAQEIACIEAPPAVVLTESTNTNNDHVIINDSINSQKEGFVMITLNRDHKNRRSSLCVFTSPDLRASIRLPKTVFAGDVPESFVIDAPEGTFAAAKVDRATLTKEQRKALRDARPKLTTAQKFAKQEARLAKLRAKMEAEVAKANESTESTPDPVAASM